MKTVYCIKVRMSDSDPWGPTLYYREEKRRDKYGAECRIIAGFRTYSFTEQKTAEEIKQIEFEDFQKW
jgi:hypothetical protein